MSKDTDHFPVSPEELDKFLKEHGFNPTVTTEGSLNMVSIELAVKINKKNLKYLADLANKSQKKE